MTSDPAHPRTRISFHVTNMDSGESAGALTEVVLRLDNDAIVRVDLPMRRIEIEASKAEARDFRDAINMAGFVPVRQWMPDLA
jgi:hypothetical protein